MSDLDTKTSFVALCSGNASVLSVVSEACRRGIVPFELRAIVCDRKCGAIGLARRLGIPSEIVDPHEFAAKGLFQAALKKAILVHQPDVLLLYFDRLIERPLIEAMRGRIINTHYSLLPAFTGFRAISKALNRGCRFTGITLHYVDEGVDSGSIVAQSVCPVLPSDSEATLGRRLFEASLSLTLAMLEFYPNIPCVPGETLKLKDGTMCFSSLEVPGKIRAFLEEAGF